MSKKKKAKKKKIKSLKKYSGIFLFGITLLITMISIMNIIKLNLLPMKYFIPYLIVEIIILSIVAFLWKRKKRIWFIIGLIIIILLNTGNIFLNSYVQKANHFIEKTFQEYITISTDYIVLTSNNNSINTIEELDKNQYIFYYEYSRSIDLARKELKKFDYVSTDSISKILSLMDEYPDNYLLISRGEFDYLTENSIIYNKENYKILTSFTVSYQEKVNKEVKDSYTIYLNGTDFTGIMRDFNVLITINTKKKQVLMTSVLRGYYIDVPAYGIKDTLMCLGSLDSNVSKEALEKLLDTKIDYTINVNTNSLIDIVDTLGGIEFCSDYSFTTTHILTDNTYVDRNGTKLEVVKGCREYNGLETLAIARERLHLKNNERGRLDNCGKILISIIKKSLSTTSLLNFEEVLNSYSNLYTTDMNKTVMTNLAKSFIANYQDYEILTQSLDGVDGTAMGHLGTQEVGVTFPDYEQVRVAGLNIKEILRG